MSIDEESEQSESDEGRSDEAEQSESEEETRKEKTKQQSESSEDESESEESSDDEANKSDSEVMSMEKPKQSESVETRKNESEELSKVITKQQSEYEESSNEESESEETSKEKTEHLESESSSEEQEEEVKDFLTVTMSLLEEDEEKIGPMVGYFPVAYNPLDKERHPDPPRVRLYKGDKRPKRMELVVEPVDEPIRFVGTNYKGEAEVAQHVSYGVGVLDRKNGTLKIVPVAGDKIFRLEPRSKSEGIHDKQAEEEEKHTPEQNYEHVRQLADRYGTKNSVKTNKHFAKLYQSKDVGLGIEVADDLFDKNAVVVSNSGISGNIPPHNLLADTPEKAYPLDNIILIGDWVYLMDIWELSKSNKKVKAGIYPSFVCNRVHKLDLIQDVSEKKRLAGILSYITHLIKFRDKYSMDGASSARDHEFPRILSQKLTTLFFDVERKRLSDGKQGLLTSYILVLTLHFDEFKTDPTDIARDLRMDYASLRRDYEKVGCRFTRENNVTIATLPVPLNLNFAGKRRKRRRG